jgi:hypothetical protein
MLTAVTHAFGCTDIARPEWFAAKRSSPAGVGCEYRAAPCNIEGSTRFVTPAPMPIVPHGTLVQRHTFATELANSDVSAYALMRLLGHESMVTSHRYVTAAGTENRTAAAQNSLYRLVVKDAGDQNRLARTGNGAHLHFVVSTVGRDRYGTIEDEIASAAPHCTTYVLDRCYWCHRRSTALQRL